MRERWDQLRGVLVIRMNHDDDVSALVQGRGVASLLVRAVATVALVNDGVEAQATRKLGGTVGRAVVDQDDLVDHLRDFGDGSLQRSRRVVRGQDEHELAALDHDRDCIITNAVPDKSLRMRAQLLGARA